MIFDAGRDYLNNIALALSVSPPSDYYILFIRNTGFTGLSSDDTMTSHSGWVEEQNYSGNRPTWNASDSVGGIVSNAENKITLTATADIHIIGYVLVTNNTKGGTTGVAVGGELFQGNGVQIVSGRTATFIVSFSGQSG